MSTVLHHPLRRRETRRRAKRPRPVADLVARRAPVHLERGQHLVQPPRLAQLAHQRCDRRSAGGRNQRPEALPQLCCSRPRGSSPSRGCMLPPPRRYPLSPPRLEVTAAALVCSYTTIWDITSCRPPGAAISAVGGRRFLPVRNQLLHGPTKVFRRSPITFGESKLRADLYSVLGSAFGRHRSALCTFIALSEPPRPFEADHGWGQRC